VDDGEGLRVQRLARGVLPDRVSASDETAVAYVDELVELYLDRPYELDEALHPLERGGAPPIYAGVGPARSLPIDGVLGIKLLDHGLGAGFVPRLVGTPDGGGVLVGHRTKYVTPHRPRPGRLGRGEADGYKPGMDEETFNLSVRRFLKKLGVTAQREIELGVRERLDAGELEGDETLSARATVTVQGVDREILVEGDIKLS
jgi:Family of unknown function (DUF6494)